MQLSPEDQKYARQEGLVSDRICYYVRMNTKSDAITMLCYGDSNTWGQKPDKSGRYAADIRWTGVLQQNVGNNYYIIEEGLSSRTTDLEYPSKPGRNGKTYLTPCIASHNPLDLVVIMLGTNDFKVEFNRSAPQIASAVHGLVDDIRTNAWNKQKTPPQIIVVSPILVDIKATNFQDFYSGVYDGESVLKSQQLAPELANVCDDVECHFLDAASVARAGTDGIHFDKASHRALGTLIADSARRIKL